MPLLMETWLTVIAIFLIGLLIGWFIWGRKTL